MSLEVFPDETILQICQMMDTQSIAKFMRTSYRNYNICHEVLVDKLIEKFHSRSLTKDEINDILADLTSNFDDIGDDPNADEILPIILQDPRTTINAKLFAEAFKLDFNKTIRAILKSGKVDPNDPEIFENIRAYEDEYFPSHRIVKLIVMDPRVTPESKRLYEQNFLASYSVERGRQFPKEQFAQFYLYNLGFNPEDLRKVSEELTLAEEKLEQYTQYWKDVYLRDIDKPTLEDLIFFLGLKPSISEAQDFLDRMGNLPEEKRLKILKDVDMYHDEAFAYDPVTNTLSAITVPGEEEDLENL